MILALQQMVQDINDARQLQQHHSQDDDQHANLNISAESSSSSNNNNHNSSSSNTFTELGFQANEQNALNSRCLLGPFMAGGSITDDDDMANRDDRRRRRLKQRQQPALPSAQALDPPWHRTFFVTHLREPVARIKSEVSSLINR